MSKLQPVRGTRDICGDDARRFSQVVDIFKSVAGRFGFREIATPLFEFSEVFRRTLGETSDVVSKEMYSFIDRGGDEITLRPEYTAGIARAYLSGGMQQEGVVKLYAYGPMFRYERPQKGRYRQFHQLDVEILGAPEPQADVEIIALGQQLLEEMGLASQATLHLNSLGDPESRQAYRVALVAYFDGNKDTLSKDSLARLSRNPLRILDSKDEGDQKLVANAPVMVDYLNETSRDFITSVKRGLDILGIEYTDNPKLVRGLDYYCHTAFEFITNDLGAQGTVIGGGRYDGLIEQMGGPATAGVGWAAGIERLGMLLSDVPEGPRPVALIPLGEAAEEKALKIASQLRKAGRTVDMAFRGKLKKRLSRANKQNARYAIILGENELAKGQAIIRDLDEGSQREVPLEGLLAALPPES